ncbi:DNA-binding anti-repressor SinI [Alicyclobacillus tolerans]|nr:DNA-binding anti-repressor SinI [Alicyclobacillus montanus]QRF22739.1 DNA-binding anti-repressor SinI [Alicyclobacillus sp. TC]
MTDKENKRDTESLQDWEGLMAMARDFGLTKEEVRRFLSSRTIQTLS